MAQKKKSKTYSLKPSTTRLVAAMAHRQGLNESDIAEEALRFWALSHGPVGVEPYEDQAQGDEQELVAAEGRDNAA